MRGQRRQWSVQASLERAFDGDVLESMDHAAPFPEMKALRLDLQTERRRWRLLVHMPVDEKLTLWCPYRHLGEGPSSMAVRENAGERIHREVGRRRAPRRVCDRKPP